MSVWLLMLPLLLVAATPQNAARGDPSTVNKRLDVLACSSQHAWQHPPAL